MYFSISGLAIKMKPNESEQFIWIIKKVYKKRTMSIIYREPLECSLTL